MARFSELLTIYILLSYLSLIHLTQSSTSGQCSISDDGSDTDCNPCQNDQWVSQNGTVPGYHVICITQDPATSSLNIQFYREGVAEQTHSGQYISDAKTIKDLRAELERILKIKKTDILRNALSNEADKPNPWAIFNPNGVRIIDINLCRGTLLIFESGVFIYPAIHIGFERDVNIKDENDEETIFKLVTLRYLHHIYR